MGVGCSQGVLSLRPAKVLIMIVSFQSFGSSIIKAHVATDKVVSKARDTIAQSMQQFLDSCSLAGITRDEDGTKSIGAEIRGSQCFIDAVAQGLIEQTTVTNYAQGAMRAYFHNAAWYASAFVSEEKGGLPALPWSKGGKGKTGAKTGKVKTTDNAALLDTLRKAIEQAMLLNRLEVKGMLIDVAVEIDPSFTV